MRIIAPSILSADFGNLAKEIEMVNRSEADWLHLDIMDGLFVPNISFGFPVVEAVAKLSEKPLDAHLMIMNPERYVKRFAEVGVSWLSFHLEATEDVQKCVDLIHESGMKSGLAIKPATPVSSIRQFLPELDYIVVMSVEPGYSGQKFMPEALYKAAETKRLVEEVNPDCLIQMDGGISQDNIDEIEKSGVDIFVAANAVFGADNPSDAIAALKRKKSL